jgi:uncharacterized protein
MPSNRETVESIYQAFGRGDIAAIVERLAPDVEWDPPGTSSAQRAGVASVQPRRGAAQAMEFFRVVGGLQFHEFKLLDLVGEGDCVAARMLVRCTVPATGQRIDDDCETHWWHFDSQGRVRSLRHAIDTAQHLRAWGLQTPA